MLFFPYFHLFSNKLFIFCIIYGTITWNNELIIYYSLRSRDTIVKIWGMILTSILRYNKTIWWYQKLISSYLDTMNL